MESAQREIICVLLKRLFDLGLLSKQGCSDALDLARSMSGLPDCFKRAACPAAEADADAGAAAPQ